ncbi:peptidase domain-containing ABC transporter [Solitalea sp. MAHUQ-68]|uniref:Peptidase domain-containing ABC transporter n=1 Tax=Solitalea agri TaxID=2953739 RepID=A0A9X2F2L8_9SPHI|nr:peptidase domain-containing ABC transporter [Solitalea agri]MCO4293564.1 peptidase domain-containing ABC transporter [Solitalea agri]
MKKVKQRDITDCGAACLASVAAHYKLQIPVARIRQLAGTDKKGTNVLGIIEAAEKLGFQAKGVKGPFESLNKIPKPAIAHVIVKEVLHHYVVIYDVTTKHVVVMDPADGKIHHILHEEFKKQWTCILILLVPNDDFKIGNEKQSNLKRFWHLLRPHKAVMMQTLFGAAIYTLLGLSVSIYVQQLIDRALPESNQNLLNLLSIGMILILLMQSFIGYMKSVFAIKTGQQIDARLILGYYKHLLKLPQTFFDTMRVGEILSRVNDAVKIRAFINDIVLNMAVNVLMLFFSFALMFTYYWKMALISLIIIPVYSLVYIISNSINKKLQRKLMEDAANLETQLVESLNGVSTIKRFGLEDFANVKTEIQFVKLLKTIYYTTIRSLEIGNITDFLSKVFTIIILWLGSTFVIKGEISPGELLSFYALIGYFTGPVSQLISSNKSMQEALIAADRLFEILDLEREESTEKIQLSKEQIGDIVFEEVAFRYGTRIQVFNSLSVNIPKGKITAIVGESGSGKSTISSLIQNLYPLQKGSIKLGSVHTNHISADCLRTLVSVVPQQIDLFAGSIIENIAIGDFRPDVQKTLEIAQLLGINEFVEKMPGGYQTLLGEHGVNLSGGQRQRIAIARAMYRDPEVLILDEATSSLDPVAEQYVQKAIAALKERGKTIILIAHRLSTVIHADQIIVLENGKVAEQGTHYELLRNQRVYTKLWQHHQGLVIS